MNLKISIIKIYDDRNNFVRHDPFNLNNNLLISIIVSFISTFILSILNANYDFVFMSDDFWFFIQSKRS